MTTEGMGEFWLLVAPFWRNGGLNLGKIITTNNLPERKKKLSIVHKTC